MKAIKTIAARTLAIMVALFLCLGTTTTAFAATFADLQDAINGSEENYAWNEETNQYGITASTGKDDEGNDVRNVTLHEDVQREDNEKGVTIGNGKNVSLDLNGNDVNAKTEDGKALEGSVITVEKDSSLTLDDSKATGSEEDGTYESGKITGGYTAVDMMADSEFTMNGGTLSDNDGDGLGGGVVDRGEFTMNGGVISDNDVANMGGGVYVNQTGEFTMNGGAISGNEAANGGGVYVNDGVFTMNGGAISDNEATTGNGGGVYVNDGTFTMNGGAIDGNSTNVNFTHEDYAGTDAPTQGGGVYVTGANGEFDLNGGIISGNTAGEGGGVFINHLSGFEMEGGEVSGNTAKFGEGGGIYVWGEGTISAGKITGNTTETQRDLGGGGIYIEANGKLHLYNAIITNNTADGLGGGLAACVHGKTIVYVNNGAFIYGNHADGTATTGEGHITDGYQNGNGTLIDGHDLWENDEDFKAGAQDIFAASDKGKENDSGIPGIIVGSDTLFGDANWTGYLFLYNEDGTLLKDEDGNPIWTEVTMDNQGGFVYGNRLLGLTANPDAETIKAAELAAQEAVENHVIISGNHSSTHGGGIGNNGTLTIGEESNFEDDDTPDKVEGGKELEKAEGAEGGGNRELKDEEFTFVLTDADGNEYEGTNDKDGNIVIQLPKDYFTEKLKGESMADGEYTYTFTVKEKKTDDGTIIFDESEYEVTITVKKETVTFEIDGKPVVIGRVSNIQTETFTTESITITKDGESVDKIVFTNKYTPAVVSGGGSVTVTRGNDPDPKTPEETTGEDVELPEEEIPLAEIPDGEIPLAEIPDEEIELDDPSIPLSDVPQTGDISLLWYAVAGMSACGLLGLSKKRKDEDA